MIPQFRRGRQDFLGDGSWKTYGNFIVPAFGYVHHEFLDAFSARRVRVTPRKGYLVPAYFIYN